MSSPDAHRPPRSRRGWISVVVLLLVAVAAASLQAEPAERTPHFVEHAPVNIAHAGAQGHAPQNTIPAFERAVGLGAEVLEMDLQLTADDVPVVIHDGTVDRTTDGSGRVRDMTLEEVKQLETGHDFPGPEGDHPFIGEGVEIPTLAEVFAAFPDAWMVVEMKTESGDGIVRATADLIREHGREDRTVVASFSLDLLREFRELVPGVATNMPEAEGRDFHIHMLLGTHRWWGPPGEFLQVPVDFEGMRVVTPGFVRAAEHRGTDVHVWTVNETDEMHWLLNQGVHGILTDHPDRFDDVLVERRAAAEERADPDLHPGLGFVQGVQDRFGWLTSLMSAITWLGDEEAYVLVFPLVLWSIHRTIGIHLAVVFLLSASLNAIGKLAGRTPRPSFIDPSLGLRAESSFGVPSGHAQNAVVVWGYLAVALRRRWAWTVAGLLVLLLGVSRLQLGVHFPLDTIVGWAVGALVLLAYLRWQAPAVARVVAMTPRRQLWLAFGVSVGLVALAVTVRLVNIGWELPVGWIGVDPTHPPMAVSDTVTTAAALFGVAAGLVFVRNRGGFSTDGPIWQRLARIPVGLAGVGVLWFGLGELFPGGEDPVALAYRYLRYAAVGMWVAGLAPLAFVRLGLAASDPAFTAAPAPEPGPGAARA